MKINFRMMISFFLVIVSQQGFASLGNQAISPVGFWKTIDDVSNKPKAIVRITENSDHVAFGKIVKVFPVPGEKLLTVCTACRDDRQNQPIVGMTILKDLRQNQNNLSEWEGGEILDPKTGKVYHFQAQIIEDGQRLRARGYIGFPLFGRTQIWHRVAGVNSK